MPAAPPNFATVARRRTGGYTLVELVTVIIVLGILAALGGSLFVENFKATRYSNLDNSQDAEARYVMERIAREIREIKFDGNIANPHYCISSTLQNPSSSITFWKANASASDCATGVGVTVSAANQYLNLTYLNLTSPLGTATLTQQLQSGGGFNLTYYDAWGGVTTNTAMVQAVGIELTLTAGTEGPVSRQRTRVGLRNR